MPIHQDDLQRLVRRVEQLYRLKELNAPQAIVEKQEGMIMYALGTVLRDKDPETFTLPSYAETEQRLDTVLKLHQHGKLLEACQRALPYLRHLRETYEDGAPELEDWHTVNGAIQSVTGDVDEPE